MAPPSSRNPRGSIWPDPLWFGGMGADQKLCPAKYAAELEGGITASAWRVAEWLVFPLFMLRVRRLTPKRARVKLRRTMTLLPLCLLAMASIWGTRIIRPNNSQSVLAEAVPLNPNNPTQRTVGALTFIGAWHLRSDNSDFGGFSALGRLHDGRFLAISDAGWMAAFQLTPTANGAARISDSFIARLPDAEGVGPDGGDIDYKDRDSESMTADGERGRYWIGYEQRNVIRRLDGGFVRVTAMAAPKSMAAWPTNSGPEGMVRLSDGRFLIFAENSDTDMGGTKVLLFQGDPTEKGTQALQLSYAAPDGYRVTDAAQMPGGDVLLLNRSIGIPDGFTAKITRVSLADVRAGAVLKGDVIATLASPLTVDNMEGLLVERGQIGGRDAAVIWLISDDNYFGFQRTLLMQFALFEGHEKDAAPGFQSR
jgi:hypothetical protein